MKKISLFITLIMLITSFAIPINAIADEENAASPESVQEQNLPEKAESPDKNKPEQSGNNSNEKAVGEEGKNNATSVKDEQNRKTVRRVPQGRGTKAFTVTKKSVGSTDEGELVGEYDTFHKAIEACKQEDLSNRYIVTMNKDYTIPATEGSWSKSSVNMLLKSKAGETYTLKRMGNRDIMSIDKKATLRIENVILDGHNDGQAFMVAGGNDQQGAHLILGKGTVVQNFQDTPDYDGTTFYLYHGNSILTIEEGAVLQNNTAEKQGGGVIQGREDTVINIKGGLFKNNSSKSGGGVLFTNGKLNITGGTFESNTAKYGGALWIGSKSTATVENATFLKNKTTSSYGGGAIWGSSDFKIKNSTFEGNKAKLDKEKGGAVYGAKGMTIEKSTFKGNEADYGGALAISADMKMTVKDSKFIGNTASFAGAIYMKPSAEESTINDCSFTNNEATDQGGAIWSNNAPISIEDSLFENNGKATGYAGGLCLNGDKSYNVKNSIFKGNKAKLGGGIFVMGGKLSVEGTTLESNIAETETDQQGNVTKGVGGAILSLQNGNINSEMIISKSKIKNNEARNGAGITVGSGKVEIKDTEFNGNDTKGPEDDQDKRLGGALYVDDVADVNISETSKFINNKAGIGGAIFDAAADYSNPADTSKYQNLKIEGTTLFKGNEARTGLNQPPINFEKFDNLLFSEKSDIPHDKYMSKSLLNNYDINYQGGLLITYDANGGKFTDGKSIKQELHKENDTIKITAAPMREGYQFLYWKGSKYNPGDLYTVKDSHIFVAQWNKIPELEVKDATITVGDKIDLKSLITKAEDEEDGKNLNNSVVIDKGNFDNNKVGKYRITYKLTDKNGASVTKTVTVTVNSKAGNPEQPGDNPSKKPGNTTSKPKKPQKSKVINKPETGDGMNTSVYALLMGTFGTLLVTAGAARALKGKRKNNG